jgi:hypothetical protein
MASKYRRYIYISVLRPHVFTADLRKTKNIGSKKNIGHTWFAASPQRGQGYIHCHHQQSKQCHLAGGAQCEPVQHFVDGSHGP